jgi:hypothetical protein
MKGLGTRKLNNGAVEIHGVFDGFSVNGNGYKKWKRVVIHQTSSSMNPPPGQQQSTVLNQSQITAPSVILTKNLSSSIYRETQTFIYRGSLKDSRIDG